MERPTTIGFYSIQFGVAIHTVNCCQFPQWQMTRGALSLSPGTILLIFLLFGMSGWPWMWRELIQWDLYFTAGRVANDDSDQSGAQCLLDYSALSMVLRWPRREWTLIDSVNGSGCYLHCWMHFHQASIWMTIQDDNQKTYRMDGFIIYVLKMLTRSVESGVFPNSWLEKQSSAIKWQFNCTIASHKGTKSETRT